MEALGTGCQGRSCGCRIACRCRHHWLGLGNQSRAPLSSLLCFASPWISRLWPSVCGASQVQKSSSAASSAIIYWQWNKPQAEIRSFPVEHIGPIACNTDGTYSVGGGSSGRIYLWEVPSGQLLKLWPAHYKAPCLVFSGDESLLIAGAEDGFVRAWPLLIALYEDAALPAETQCQPLHDHNLPVTDIVCGYGGCNAIIVSSFSDFTCKLASV